MGQFWVKTIALSGSVLGDRQQSAMNIELDEVVVQDVSDESLERAAGGAKGGGTVRTALQDVPGAINCAVVVKTLTLG